MKPVGSASPGQSARVQNEPAESAKFETGKSAQVIEAGESRAKTPEMSPEKKAELTAEKQMGGAALEAEIRRRWGSKDPKPAPQVIQEEPNYEMKDADKLKAPDSDLDKQYLKQTVTSMFKSDITNQPGHFMKNFERAPKSEQDEMRAALRESLSKDSGLRNWINEKPERLERAKEIVGKLWPDPGKNENIKVNETLKNFKDWDKYNKPPEKYPLIVVPGYTPLSQKTPIPLHPTAKERCQMAYDAFKKDRAPFIMVSGGNVHPEGTRFNEAIEMKRELMKMGVPEDRIIVEGMARHSTTNLRNAGRFMVDHKIKDALVLTDGGQGFYMGEPYLSTYHLRSQAELGYTVGRLNGTLTDKGDIEVRFQPSPDVKKYDLADPLDP